MKNAFILGIFALINFVNGLPEAIPIEKYDSVQDLERSASDALTEGDSGWGRRAVGSSCSTPYVSPEIPQE
jgi:hypothetical protein